MSGWITIKPTDAARIDEAVRPSRRQRRELDTVDEAYILGDSIRPEERTDRFTGLTFRVTITPADAFRAEVVVEQLPEFKRRVSSWSKRDRGQC